MYTLPNHEIAKQKQSGLVIYLPNQTFLHWLANVEQAHAIGYLVPESCM